jgi:hypothetical protein
LPSGLLGLHDFAPLRRLASARAAERQMSMGFSSDDAGDARATARWKQSTRP